MPGHLSTRIFTAATGGLVRSAAPAVTRAVVALAQLLGFMVLAGLLLIGIHIAGWAVLEPLAIALVLVPLVFALLVVVEQIRVTYARPTEAVYPMVEVFPDREPM